MKFLGRIKLDIEGTRRSACSSLLIFSNSLPSIIYVEGIVEVKLEKKNIFFIVSPISDFHKYLEHEII